MRPHPRLTAALSAALALIAMLATGCAAGQTSPAQTTASPLRVFLYGTDGNMFNEVGTALANYPGGLVGMKGTTPLTRLSETFRSRLRAVDPSLTSDVYAAESYDAVVITALAAQLAGTTDPSAIAAQVTGVTVGGTGCGSPALCLELAASGQDLAYRGISMRYGGFTDVGEPAAASYGILRFGADNQLDASQTEFVPTGEPAKVSTRAPPRPRRTGPKGPLRIGALLPHTGALAAAGPPLFAGARLAVNEVNAAGGVLGQPVQWRDGDDFTDPRRAAETVSGHLAAGVQVILGAGASSISAAVLPAVVAAGAILFSPCNTAPSLTQVDDRGRYFRTAPTDLLQAIALTDIIARDGVRRLYIVARHDAYGEGLANAVRDNLVHAGVAGFDIKIHLYETERADFDGLGREVRAFAPDGVLLIGYTESADALLSIFEAGLSSRIS